MTQICDCNGLRLVNLGTPGGCEGSGFGTPYKITIAPYFRDDMTVNSIDLTDTLDAAFFGDHYNQYNASGALVAFEDKWAITDVLEEVKTERSDPKYKTYSSGRKTRLEDGVRSLEFIIKDAVFEFMAELSRLGCKDWGIFIHDKAGNWLGDGISEPGKLRLLRMDKSSFDHRLMLAVDDDVTSIKVMVDFHPLMTDNNLKRLRASDITGYNVSTQEGNYNIDVDQVGTMSTTVQTVRLFHNYGSTENQPVPGLVTANFKYWNDTDDAVVTPSGVVEDPAEPGKYAITYGAQTNADVMKLRIIEAGIDDSLVYANNFVIGS